MSNKLRSFLIVVISIAVVMVALPMNALRVNAEGYSVCYWLDDDASSPVEVLDSETVLSPDDEKLNFKKDGYKFTGWTDFSGHPYSVGDPVDKELELKGTWTEDTDNYVTVTFMPNNGEIDGDPVTIQVAKTGTGIAVPTEWTVPAGYRLDKWTTNANGSVESYNTTDSYTLSGDTTLYGQWKEFYTITFNANDGTNRTHQETQDKDPSGTTKYQLRPDVFPYDGYIVDYWTHSSGGSSSGVSYGASDLITLTENLSLNAYWVREITFHAHNGKEPEETPTTQRIPIKDKQPLDANGFTAPAGKTFVGWSTQPDDTTIKYVDKASVEITGDNTKDIEHDLYAQWGSICTITFDANDSLLYAKTSDTMANQVVGKGFTTPINANTYHVEGYEFTGWNTQPDGNGTSYTDTISLADDCADTITLYAQWKAVPHTLTFMSEDGNTQVGTVSCNHWSTPDSSFFPAAPAKDSTNDKDFTFDGWSATPNSEGSVITSYPVVEGNATYYAHYTNSPRHYSISASVPSGGGTISVSGSDEWDGTATVTVTLNPGYHVVKWTDNDVDVAGDTTEYSFKVNGDHNKIIAVLALDSKTVTVNAAQGGQATIDKNTYLYGEQATAVATADTGYTFSNWTENDGTVVSYDSTYTFEVKADHDLTANFSINSYEITLYSDGNGTVEGEGAYNYSSTATVTASPNTGYYFVNWTDGDGNEVSTNASYSFTVNDARSLKANFARKSYNIDVEAEDHGSVTGSGIYLYAEEVTVKAKPETGYHFVNWTIDGNVVSTNANYTFKVSGPADLKANFAINTYTVKFVNDDGTLLREGEFVYGSTAFYQVNATPTKKATAQYTYTFAGWDKKLGTVTEDITYTAVYDATVNKYKITFQNEDGSVLQTSEVEYGKLPVFENGTPTKASTVQESFTFAGWDKDISKVTGEAVYTATYTAKKITRDDINYLHFTVSFESNGGSEVVSQLVADGGVAFKPEEPMRERYTFGGWYIDAALTKPFSFSTPITSDITLYAKWIKGSPEVEATYAVVGLGSMTWTEGSDEDFAVTIERSKENDTISSHFKGVQIDGVDLDYYLYELSEENGTVIIRSDAFDDLDAGTHTITIVYDDGTAEAELVISKEDKTVGTSDEPTPTEAGGGEPEVLPAEKPSLLGLWIALAVVGGVIICVLPIIIIKRRGVK